MLAAALPQWFLRTFPCLRATMTRPQVERARGAKSSTYMAFFLRDKGPHTMRSTRLFSLILSLLDSYKSCLCAPPSHFFRSYQTPQSKQAYKLYLADPHILQNFIATRNHDSYESSICLPPTDLAEPLYTRATCPKALPQEAPVMALPPVTAIA